MIGLFASTIANWTRQPPIGIRRRAGRPNTITSR
jgi:hypothetical protein